MADDRPALDPTDQLAKLQRDFDDLRSTVLARTSRAVTGTVEATLLPAAKPDTLLLNGQAVSRTTYAVLWRWVQDNALVTGGLFTGGDGTTTFGLPDFRGRVPVGANPGTVALGALVGADSVALSTSNLPSHNHTGGTDTYGHDHGWAGNHGHNLVNQRYSTPGQPHDHYGVPGTTSEGTSGAGTAGGGNASVTGVGDHLHGWSDHSHGFTTNATGGGAAFDNRQASIAVNFLIWV